MCYQTHVVIKILLMWGIACLSVRITIKAGLIRVGEGKQQLTKQPITFVTGCLILREMISPKRNPLSGEARKRLLI